MAKAKKPDPKSEACRRTACSIPIPKRVRDDLFIRQSILRCQRPGPGALRDGAAPPDRRHCNQPIAAATFGVTPADLLTRPRSAADDWSCWSAAEQDAVQERPQDLHRGGCLRCRSQNRKPRSDELRQCVGRSKRGSESRCHRRSLERALAPQKKTNHPNLIVAPSDTRTLRDVARRGIARRGRAWSRHFSTTEVWRNGFEHSGRSPLSR